MVQALDAHPVLAHHQELTVTHGRKAEVVVVDRREEAACTAVVPVWYRPLAKVVLHLHGARREGPKKSLPDVLLVVTRALGRRRALDEDTWEVRRHELGAIKAPVPVKDPEEVGAGLVFGLSIYVELRQVSVLVVMKTSLPSMECAGRSKVLVVSADGFHLELFPSNPLAPYGRAGVLDGLAVGRYHGHVFVDAAVRYELHAGVCQLLLVLVNLVVKAQVGGGQLSTTLPLLLLSFHVPAGRKRRATPHRLGKSA
mmetsp:Transcript_13629/g.27120  ORF Transcript_13629/g.27120 Transcript_13629/m.27120 type:complete len:255 (+) Transcript_13629:689-1453(+)